MKQDYIIIGGGSAGCVLADRLSASGDSTVCVLEAGSDNKSTLVSTPGAFAAFMFLKKFNWSFNATSQADIRNGEPMFVPRGRGLGGSSATNAMLYIRGQAEDYDHWADLGNTGWSYADMLPQFKRCETNEMGASNFHGDSGPLHVSTRPIYYETSRIFVNAGQEVGIPYTDDFNGADQEGIGYYQCTIKDGERCGAKRAFLEPALSRSNLIVKTGAFVKRILFSNKTAIGVEYEQGGQIHTILANKEVILSAGAIQSPQILMLSGVGPQAELAKHGIPLIHDLPGVGQNLQEHVDACVLVTSKKKDGFTASLGGLLRMAPHAWRYFTSKTGKLSNSVTEAGAFIKSREDIPTPDIQLHMVPLLYDDNGRDLKLMGQHGYSCHVCVLRPESRGEITLQSAHYKDAPNIDFNFFSDPEGKDRQVIIDGMRQVRKILNAPSFAEHHLEEIHPGIEHESDEAIFAKAKERLGLVYHPVGTCKMGQDPLAVVDTDLCVHGMHNLRVIDASIMPTLISGNTNAPTMAIAQKGADAILSASAESKQTTAAA